MTLKQAVKILKVEHIGDSEYLELAKYMGAFALEKQISKKPIVMFGLRCRFVRCCPVCKKQLLATNNYCSNCGQALDWGNNNVE